MDLPGYNIELVKKRIRELQEKYEKEIKPHEKDYNEQNTKKDFIEPILRILNWDTETKTQVDAEFCIKNQRSSGSADYALKINEEVKLLLEAKSFDKDLETGYDVVNGQKRTYVEQLVGYAFDLNRHMKTKIDYCILTNGKEWRVYNVQWQGVAFDKKLVFVLKIEEFVDKFRKFWSLERGNVSKGDIDRFVTEGDKLPIDRKAVTSLLYCKKLLIDSVIKDYEANKRDMKYMIDKLISKPIKDAPNGFPKFYEMPEDERLNKFVLEASSNVINKILFIRIIEDKGYLKPKLTKRSVEEWKSWFQQADRILSLFRTACHEADELYNGGIFDVNPYDELNYDSDVLDKIIGILGDFNFEEIDADVIGRIYEIYLGTVLSVEEEIRGKKRTKLSADYTERKKLGQYYTPKFVVDFIVKNTLGRLLEGKTPKEVSQIKVLDPACGSGSFLIRAFDYLKDYYVRYNDQQMSKVKKSGSGNMNNYVENGEIIDYNHRILRENLHGVDLNDLSVQICSINLWLRALEKDKKLEKLSKNILHGNSLISGVEGKEELAKYKTELKEIAKLREKIKEYYGKELNKKEQDELEDMESKLRELRNKVSSPLNENLKKYFENLDLVHPFNWEVEFTEVFEPDKPKEEQGFDVVIGNPPYVGWAKGKIPRNYKDYYEDQFSSIYSGKNDLYYYFIYTSLKLLKEGGLFSFITSRYFMESVWAKELRDTITNNLFIEKIVDFRDKKIFEDANVHTCITVIRKKQGMNPKVEVRLGEINSSPFYINQKELVSHIWKLENRQNVAISEKIEKNSKPITDFFDIKDTKLSALDKVYILNEEEINKRKIETKYVRKFINSNDIQPYCYSWCRKYLIDISKDTLIEQNSNLLKYLKEKEKDILKRNKIRKEDLGYGLARPMMEYPWDEVKIFCPSRDTKNEFILDEEGMVGSRHNTTVLFPKTKDDIKYFLGLLNSRLFEYYFKKNSKKMGESYEYLPQFLDKLRIKVSKDKIVSQISSAVDNLIKYKKTQNRLVCIFSHVSNNQPIPHEKDCKFGHYWDFSHLYDFSKDTIPFANKTKAKILDMEIKEENNKLVIYTTNISLMQDKQFDNIKTVELTIKNEVLRKFLYFSIKKYINEKRGSFGSGIILEIIKEIPVPVYVVTANINLGKIKRVMDDFEHETKDLWKIDGKTYKSLSEIEGDIEKTDNEIDEAVYKLYGITEEEKKVIEESLK